MARSSPTIPDTAAATAPHVELFKQAMRRLATTISIVTSHEGGERRAILATSLGGFTAEPPTIAVGINRLSPVHAAVSASGVFCANLLSAESYDLVTHFTTTRSGEARFQLGDWETDDQGCPVLRNAMASLSCTVVAQLTYATHTLFVGEVGDIRLGASTDPLLWQDGALFATRPHARGDG